MQVAEAGILACVVRVVFMFACVLGPVAAAAAGVVEATTAVVAGDLDMSVSSREAESRALDEWGIDSPLAYGQAY